MAARGRPRAFDRSAALERAMQVFWAKGYEATQLADLTAAMGINPPSFYAAFGSKAALYARTLARYTGTEGIPLAEILRPGRPIAEALATVLEEAARRYAADPAAAGCLVLEGVRCDDQGARQAALAYNLAAEGVIRDYVAARCPKQAEQLTDFVSTTMSGLSAKARTGHGVDQLLATARLASLALTRTAEA